MHLTISNVGILLNAVVSAIVAIAAMALTIFIFRRRKRFDVAMQAYSLFWLFTAFTWISISIRYILIILEAPASTVLLFDVFMQIGIFFSGPPLIFYVSYRLFNKQKLSSFLGIVSTALAVAALWFTIQPDGFTAAPRTFFAAENQVNMQSFAIFGIEAGIILLLLIYDVILRLGHWRWRHSKTALYEALYSLGVILYLLFGSLDQGGIIGDWVIVVFRILYAAIFLYVYLIMIQHEATEEVYLVNTPTTG